MYGAREVFFFFSKRYAARNSAIIDFEFLREIALMRRIIFSSELSEVLFINCTLKYHIMNINELSV